MADENGMCQPSLYKVFTLIDFLTLSNAFYNKENIVILDSEFTNAIKVCLNCNIHEVTPIDICKQVLDAILWAIETKVVKIDVTDTDDVAGVLLNNNILTLKKESGKSVCSMKRPIKG